MSCVDRPGKDDQGQQARPCEEHPSDTDGPSEVSRLHDRYSIRAGGARVLVNSHVIAEHRLYVAPSRRRFRKQAARRNNASETPAQQKPYPASVKCFIARIFFPASSISIRSFRNFFLTSFPFTRKRALASETWRYSLLRGESGSRSDCANRHTGETQDGQAATRRERFQRGFPTRSGRPAFFSSTVCLA